MTDEIKTTEKLKKGYEKPELVEHGPVEKITEQIIKPPEGLGAISGVI